MEERSKSTVGVSLKEKAGNEMTTYSSINEQAAFSDGVVFALHSLWHGNQEIPDSSKNVLVKLKSQYTSMEICRYNPTFKTYDAFFSTFRPAEVDRWLYVDEITP